MDPLSQGVLGAAAPQAASRRFAALAGLLGMIAGMTPDLDIFIRSDSDPLLFLEYHRQFTHSLVFIPVGGLLCAVVLHGLFARRTLRFRDTLLYCTLGYATHGLLDACTSYGAQLLWPFSTARVAWHNISIIDPLFTLPILALVVIGGVTGRARWARFALLWACLYLGFGVVQRERAESAAELLAQSRGHAPGTVEAKPSFANLLVWKSIYEHDGYYYIDAIRTGAALAMFPGERVRKLNLARDFPWLDPDSQQARDVERFRWFSDGYLARSATDAELIIDMRYSALPNRGDGLWGVVLVRDAAPDAHVRYRTMRDTDAGTFNALFAMMANSAGTGSRLSDGQPCGTAVKPVAQPCSAGQAATTDKLLSPITSSNSTTLPSGSRP
jgi:inner membrane protein